MTIDSRRISPEMLKEHRHPAIWLCEAGHGIVQIAALVGAHRNTVGGWVNWYRRDGEAGLEVQRIGWPVGSGRKLTRPQEDTIRKMFIDKCPEQIKLPFALWTRDSVRRLVKEVGRLRCQGARHQPKRMIR